MSQPYMEDQDDDLRQRMEGLLRYLEAASTRANRRVLDAKTDYVQGLDRGYSSGYRLAAKWLRDALLANER